MAAISRATAATERPRGRVLALCVALLAFSPLAADEVAKLVHVLVEDGRLVASNIHFNRFDELKLGGKELVVEKVVAEAVAVVITNQRIIGYSVYTAAWRPLRLQANEEIRATEAEDFGALVMTSQRLLNFNGKNGVWAETRR